MLSTWMYESLGLFGCLSQHDLCWKTKVVLPKTQITEEIGSFCVFLDTEGNRVALHSQR